MYGNGLAFGWNASWSAVMLPHRAPSRLLFSRQTGAKMQRISRLKRELQLLGAEPPPGVSCWQTEHDVGELKAGERPGFLYTTI